VPPAPAGSRRWNVCARGLLSPQAARLAADQEGVGTPADFAAPSRWRQRGAHALDVELARIGTRYRQSKGARYETRARR
jgi:hypothetical protein